MSEIDREKWDARYRQQPITEREPEPFLAGLGNILPRKGRALDLAGGTGRNALWLADRGLDVTLVDISEVALERASVAAQRAGLPLRTVAADCDIDTLPPRPWDVIVSCHFLWRPFFESATELLMPGGWLVYVQPTRRNLERNASPSGRFLLDDGELPGAIRGLQIVQFTAAWRDSGRHEVWLLAQKGK